MGNVFPLPRTNWSAENDNARLATISTQAPRIPWDKFRTQILEWESGEHFALIGPTGMGKTTMLLNILPIHPFVTVFATKPRDKTMDGLIQSAGYVRLEQWRSIDPTQFPRRVLWPDATSLDSDEIQKAVFKDAFQKIYREGNWTVALDETWYLDNVLHLDGEIKKYLLQARSLGISLVTATQRPAWVPREIYSSCTHLMFWRTNDETDLRSLSGIGFRSAELIKSVVSDLDPFQVLYINTRTGYMARTKCPDVKL
jgi:energy-coupling factor transporter ATP-binding protein EcfA2